MKYRFQVMVALTYEDKRKQVSIDLSDKQVARIKNYIAKDSEQPQDLLQILEDNDKNIWTIMQRDQMTSLAK